MEKLHKIVESNFDYLIGDSVLSSTTSESERLEILSALLQFKSPASRTLALTLVSTQEIVKLIGDIANCAYDYNVSVRLAAVNTLSKDVSAISAELLRDGLSDEDQNVRRAYCAIFNQAQNKLAA